MLKKVFLAAAAAMILAGTTMTLSPAPAQASHACFKAAKAKYGSDRKDRHAYRKACNGHHKDHASKKHHWFKKKG
jgi:hypothetical protein